MDAEEDSDEILVKRAIGGDRAGFAALVSRHYDLIFKVAFKWCGRKEDAEDIAQDVCARLGQAITRFDGQARFTTWLYQVVLNATRDHQRKQHANLRKLADFAREPQAHQLQAEAKEAENDALESLWHAVRQLPQRQCDAVMLVFAEELTHSEAAKVLGCAEGTVSSNIHDAKKKLKKLLLEEARI